MSSGGVAAATYEIGYFATNAVPTTAADWATFTPIASISPKSLGVVDQTGQATPFPGQFAFQELISTRAELGLSQASDFERRLGIRFFDMSGTESNIVSAGNSGWLLRDPEALFSISSALSLTDGDLVWEGGVGTEFQTVLAVVIEPVIVACEHTGSQFEVEVGALSPSKSYVLKRGTDLSGFPTTVGSAFSGGMSHTFIDPSPPAGGRAFYRVEEQ
ncbi:MAG: hypothetical protein AAGC74_01715 [Verrucomicrobiota bacterium]